MEDQWDSFLRSGKNWSGGESIDEDFFGLVLIGSPVEVGGFLEEFGEWEGNVSKVLDELSVKPYES